MNTVFIIDDHPVIRLAIRMLLEHEGYKVVGETDNGCDAIQMVRECLPDLIILTSASQNWMGSKCYAASIP